MSVDPQWITAAAAIGGVVVGNTILWLVNTRRHRFDSLNKVYEMMQATTTERAALREVYKTYTTTNDLPGLLIVPEAEKVRITMDMIGVLYELGDLPKFAVMEMYWQSFINYWLMLEPAITAKRRRENGEIDKTYSYYFQLLYRYALEHQRDRYSKPRVTTQMQEELRK